MTEWVLPLTLRLERASPPSRTDALEAGARAVLRMVSTDVDEWRPAVDAWDGSRIRKVVRRARGAHWRAAEGLPGLTVSLRSAQIRVHPPVPLDGWPPELARLQVAGTELDDPHPPAEPPPGPLVLLSPHVEMSGGKAIAQAGHAVQLGYRALDRRTRVRWREVGFPVSVRTADASRWAQAQATGAPIVYDAGFTEVAPGSATALFLRTSR